MKLDRRTAVRALAGAGLIGATALGLAAPAAAEEQPPDFAVSVADPAPWGTPGIPLQLDVSITNNGDVDMAGWSADFTVPDGITITGIVDGEILDGTERPDEGCALVTPQRLECHTNDTLPAGERIYLAFVVSMPDDGVAPGFYYGNALFAVTADQGGTDSVVMTIFRGENVVILAVDLEPGDVTAPPGTAFDQTVRIRNFGTLPIVGSTLDFYPGKGVTVTGVTGLDLVDGAERPDEGCAVADGGLVRCHTNATIGVLSSAEVTFHLRMPDTSEYALLGDTHVQATADNGGEPSSDAAILRLDVDDTSLLEVSATPEAAGPAGEVVEIVMTATNAGPVGAAARTAELQVPDGATITGVEGFGFVEEITPPADGCVLESPQRVTCYRDGLILPGDTEQLTFLVRLDDDAPAGELGVAMLTDSGHGGTYEAETVLTVTAGDGGGEELPNTGTSSSTVTLVALGLLLAGAAGMTLRARRS